VNFVIEEMKPKCFINRTHLDASVLALEDYFKTPKVLEYEKSLIKTNTPLSVCWYNCFKTMALYFLERYEDAIVIAEGNKNLEWFVYYHLLIQIN